MEVKLMLPEVASEPEFLFKKQKFITIGPAGCGKSEFWAQEPRNLFIDTEGNLGHLKVMKMNCRSLGDFRNIYAALLERKQKDGALPYDIISVDTLDRFLAQIDEEVISLARAKYEGAIKKGLSINTIGDVPEGNGWAWRTNMTMTVLDKLCGLGLAVNLIGHTQERKIEEPTRKIDRVTINVGGQLGSQILGWSNHTLSIDGSMRGDKIVRTVYTRPRDTRDAKSHGGRIPDGLVWTDNAAENYKKLRGFFN